MSWPAGFIAKMNAALSAYNSIHAMRNASHLASWADDNPEMFSVATSVEKMRRERDKKNKARADAEDGA